MNTIPRILLVDDEPSNLRLLEKALQGKYEIFSAGNGFDAMELLKETLPDIVILDVMMPEISGYEVCRMIKEDDKYAEIPILFLTALEAPEAEILGLDVGGIDFLTKPVNFEMLRLRVRNHIKLKQHNDLVREQKDQLEVAYQEIKEQRDLLEEVLSQIKHLEGIIPICSYCKKIRDDHEVWQRLETYICQHSEAVFSHGICPECYEVQSKEWDKMLVTK